MRYTTARETMSPRGSLARSHHSTTLPIENTRHGRRRRPPRRPAVGENSARHDKACTTSTPVDNTALRVGSARHVRHGRSPRRFYHREFPDTTRQSLRQQPAGNTTPIAADVAANADPTLKMTESENTHQTNRSAMSPPALGRKSIHQLMT